MGQLNSLQIAPSFNLYGIARDFSAMKTKKSLKNKDFFWRRRRDLNSAPCERQNRRFWLFVLCCAMRNARGATFAASLKSKLPDSALLGYLRHRFAVGAREGKPLRAKQKRHRKGGVLFGGACGT